MTESMVLGERLDDLALELRAIRLETHEDGTTTVEFTLPKGSPFLRALRRAAAEVIMSGDRRARNIEARQYDVFLLVVDRMKHAVDASTT